MGHDFWKRKQGREKDTMKDFIAFSKRQCVSLDYDPFHPMVIELMKPLSKEEGFWLSTLYMAFYNMGSAWLAFANTPLLTELQPDIVKLPVGVQRRNLRGGLIAKHISLFIKSVKKYGSIEKLMTADFTGDMVKDWCVLQDNLNALWGNGRWASYTAGELYQKANGVPVFPKDIMNDGSSGPRTGLQFVMGEVKAKGKDALEELDAKADELFKLTKKRIKPNVPFLPKGHYDYAMMESLLCDFNSLRKGRYYVGRDIDRMQERIVKAELHAKELGVDTDPLKKVWKVRKKVFDHRLLGELHDWDGRTKYAKQFYFTYGKIADHMEIREALRLSSYRRS